MSFKDFIGNSAEGTGIIGILSGVLVPLVFALAFLYFVWGVVNYFFFKADEAEARAAGGQFVLWGIIGFVALVSVWGLVRIVLSTLGI
jgi:hypothetical protein